MQPPQTISTFLLGSNTADFVLTTHALMKEVAVRTQMAQAVWYDCRATTTWDSSLRGSLVASDNQPFAFIPPTNLLTRPISVTKRERRRGGERLCGEFRNLC